MFTPIVEIKDPATKGDLSQWHKHILGAAVGRRIIIVSWKSRRSVDLKSGYLGRLLRARFPHRLHMVDGKIVFECTA